MAVGSAAESCCCGNAQTQMAANAIKNSRCVVMIVLLVFPQLLFGVGLGSGDVIANEIYQTDEGNHHLSGVYSPANGTFAMQ